jgi:hypothetical protein
MESATSSKFHSYTFSTVDTDLTSKSTMLPTRDANEIEDDTAESYDCIIVEFIRSWCIYIDLSPGIV